MSKLFDRLKNAARLRGETRDRGLLAQALQRAAAERAQARAANGLLAANAHLDAGTGLGTERDRAAQADRAPDPLGAERGYVVGLSRDDSEERALRATRRRIASIVAIALALLAIIVAWVSLGERPSPPERPPVATFQLDKSLK